MDERFTRGHADFTASVAIDGIEVEARRTASEEKAWQLCRVIYGAAKLCGMYVPGVMEFRDEWGNLFNSRDLRDKYGYKKPDEHRGGER